MDGLYDYYAADAPHLRRRPVLSVVSSRWFGKSAAAVCVLGALVAASIVHIGLLLGGAIMAVALLAGGARLRQRIQDERPSHRKALVASGQLVTQDEVADCDKKDRKFVEKARSAVAVITSSNAAADGWLGDVDFGPDLFWIASSAVQASAMQELINKLKPSRRPSDKQAVAEGKHWLDARRKQLDERVKLLEDAAKHARSVDVSLVRQQETAARLALRDAETVRMAALRARLVGTQERGPRLDPGSDAGEAIQARAEAFHDVEAITRRVTDEPISTGGGFGGWLRRLVRRS